MVENDLAAFVERVTSKSLFRVESDLGHGFVRLKVSEAERRQAKQDIRCVEDAVIEMLRNAPVPSSSLRAKAGRFAALS